MARQFLQTLKRIPSCRNGDGWFGRVKDIAENGNFAWTFVAWLAEGATTLARTPGLKR